MNAHELANALETATNISTIARLTKEEVIPMLRKQAEINNEPVAWFYHRPNETGRFMCADVEAMKKIKGQDYVVTPLYAVPQDQADAIRYQWLRKEFAAGRETYIGEGMMSESACDKYIDEQMAKEQK